MKVIFFTVLIPSIILSCAQAGNRDPEFFGANFSISSCVQNAGDGAALEYFIEEKMKVNELSDDLAKHFLSGLKGKAWSFASPDGNYAITFTENNICTVFIKETNVTKYIEHMNEAFSRINKNTDWRFSTSEIPMFAGKKELKTYELSAKLPTKNVRIIISAANEATGSYQVAFSASLK